MRLLRPLWIIGFAFLLLGVIPSITGFITDLLWFREVGFQTVYVTELVTKGLLFVIVTLISYVFITLNARFATRGVSRAPVLWRVSPDLPPVDVGRSLSKVVLPVGIVFALIFGASAAANWMEVLQVTHRSSFGVV